MTPDELRAMVAVMREVGAIQADGIVLGPEPTRGSRSVESLRQQAIASAQQQGDTLPPDASLSVQMAREAATSGRELTDEEILFASSLGWPGERAGNAE